ncbi:hypothetical protein FQR65_LT13416 [Abscondita terminalis]|nr:hypothetical protein FQR65_LT13416 [Abscondita terminalis]
MGDAEGNVAGLSNVNPKPSKPQKENNFSAEDVQSDLHPQAANQRINCTRTGGGPPSKSGDTDLFDLTMSILNKKSVLGLANSCDGDAEGNAAGPSNVTPEPSKPQEENNLSAEDVQSDLHPVSVAYN